MEEVDLSLLVDNPLMANIMDGLYLRGAFNMAPLVWALLEAFRTCFPIVFGAYLILFSSLPQVEDTRQLLGPGADTGFGEEVMDAHKRMYSSFIDDTRASSNLNDVDKIRLRGYNKFRYVSSDFMKRNRITTRTSDARPPA
jgi:hypothetical protein